MSSLLRQRAVGPPAARSVLLTILGEFMLPAGREVWQETLVRSLLALDYKPEAARRALARSIAAGWLSSERHGRRSRVALTPPTIEMLTTGAERIYGFGDPPEWDGTWLFALSRVPEVRRDVRHRVRTALAWAGLGSLGGGLWISPHLGREAEVRQIAETEREADLITFTAEIGTVGDAVPILTGAWDLVAVDEGYTEFVDEFAGLRPSGPGATFAAQTRLVHAWRKFPFVDPQLPAAFLPEDWPAPRALEVFTARHSDWAETSQDFFAGLESEQAGGASEVGPAGSKSSRTASK